MGAKVYISDSPDEPIGEQIHEPSEAGTHDGERAVTSVSELGYVGIGVSDGNAWKNYAAEVLGFQLVDEGRGDRFYLRMDKWHHRIIIHTRGEDDVAYLGWRVPNAEALDEVTRQLRDIGLKVTPGTAEEAEARRVLKFVRCLDPSGIRNEVFYGVEVDQRPFHPGRPMFGPFRVGDNLGIGHAFIAAADVEKSSRFYGDGLGMPGGVEYMLGGIHKPVFFHCNERQHSLGFGIPATHGKKLVHIMIECSALDDVGRARDICKARGIPIAMDLGRHANDQMISFYMVTPSGFMIEYGWGGRKPPAQAEFYTMDGWGHEMTKHWPLTLSEDQIKR